MTRDDLIAAADQAQSDYWGIKEYEPDTPYEAAHIALAVEPLIRAAVAEEIAQAIEALDPYCHTAAAIARRHGDGTS